jgi:hypothetical protein
MQKVLNKVVAKTAALTRHQPNVQATRGGASASDSTVPSVTPKNVVCYRYQHGCNLGSIFVNEKWLTGSMYGSGATGGAELDAINACVLTRLLLQLKDILRVISTRCFLLTWHSTAH